MKNQSEYFTARFLKYGDSHLSLDWSTRERQYIMFDALTKDIAIEGKKILDIGCGLGHFLEYLQEKVKRVDYTGIDLVESMIAHAQKKHPEALFQVRRFSLGKILGQ